MKGDSGVSKPDDSSLKARAFLRKTVQGRGRGHSWKRCSDVIYVGTELP